MRGSSLALFLAFVLVLVAPFASAFDPGHGVSIGPCTASQTTGVDDWFTTVACAGPTGEVVYYRGGDGVAGPTCTLRVLDSAYPCAP
ncbi:MAG: hypothetical protein QOE90_1185 [Thermoplasmata archaeon]|nr:hypothetical protein [Thermoplasmata archaeon]